MAGKRRSHSETGWAQLPASVVRCQATRPNGEQCRREADDGSVVCDQHGGAAPQVRRRAAARVMMTADAAAQRLVAWMDDPSVPYGVRVKVAQDLMDRAGLAAAQVHKVMPVAEDPVEALFKSILDDPGGLAPASSEPLALPAGPAPSDPAQEAVDRLEESWMPDAEVVPADFGKQGPHAMSPKKSSARVPRHIAEGLGLETRR